MPEEYRKITKILVWIVAVSMIAYFVITPFTYNRPTPPIVSPGPETATPTATINLPEAEPLNLSTEPSNEIPTDLLPAGPEIEEDLLSPSIETGLGLPESQPLPVTPLPE